MLPSFNPYAQGLQSPDGSILTLYDRTNYQGNLQNHLMSDFTVRKFIITDYAGNLVGTVDLTPGYTEYDFKLTSDGYYNVELVLSSQTLDFKYNFQVPCDRFTKTLFQQYIAPTCSKGNQYKLDQADKLLTGAEIVSVVSGGGAQFNKYIQAANAYLNS